MCVSPLPTFITSFAKSGQREIRRFRSAPHVEKAERMPGSRGFRHTKS